MNKLLTRILFILALSSQAWAAQEGTVTLKKETEYLDASDDASVLAWIQKAMKDSELTPGQKVTLCFADASVAFTVPHSPTDEIKFLAHQKHKGLTIGGIRSLAMQTGKKIQAQASRLYRWTPYMPIIIGTATGSLLGYTLEENFSSTENAVVLTGTLGGLLTHCVQCGLWPTLTYREIAGITSIMSLFLPLTCYAEDRPEALESICNSLSLQGIYEGLAQFANQALGYEAQEGFGD